MADGAWDWYLVKHETEVRKATVENNTCKQSHTKLKEGCFDWIRSNYFQNADPLLCSRMYEERIPGRRWDKSIVF